jgi:hypothetical protein
MMLFVLLPSAPGETRAHYGNYKQILFRKKPLRLFGRLTRALGFGAGEAPALQFAAKQTRSRGRGDSPELDAASGAGDALGEDGGL